MNRREFITTAIGSLAIAPSIMAAPVQMEVFKSSTCGCCSAWLNHMTQAGFLLKGVDVDQTSQTALKGRSRTNSELAACHTAFADKYVIEGHVPANDIQRLLLERPYSLGLAVPGMPIGSPGVEMGEEREAFDTILMFPDGTTEFFQRHT